MVEGLLRALRQAVPALQGGLAPRIIDEGDAGGRVPEGQGLWCSARPARAQGWWRSCTPLSRR